MTENKKVMAVMKGVRFGLYTDSNFIGLYFSAYTEESIASVQAVSLENSLALIKAYKAEDIRDLEGKTVWVTIDADGVRANYHSPCVI